MHRLVIVLRNTQVERTFHEEQSAPEVLSEIAAWLASAERVAREEMRCVSFGVEVHQLGAECCHTRPARRDELSQRRRVGHG